MSLSNNRINIVYWRAGAGTDRDVSILESLLKEEGFEVRHISTPLQSGKIRRLCNFMSQFRSLFFPVRAQFHLELIYREQFSHSPVNFILPNPEFTDVDVFSKLACEPTVLCKTRHAVKLFESVPIDHKFLGFTAEDCFRDGLKKDFKKFLHVSGKSPHKGTGRIVDAWKKNPHWPTLTIIRSKTDALGEDRWKIPQTDNIELIEDWLDEDEFLRIQNEHGIHLCPSEMEGFGHYIVEAISVGSVTVTTDAPPMSEHVTHEFGFLVKGESVEKHNMSERIMVDPEELEGTINRILAMPESSLAAMGNAARQRYLKANSEFRDNFRNIIKSL
ncbi:MAG: glycosyltransferase [Puniceicoccaceae bacterium]